MHVKLLLCNHIGHWVQWKNKLDLHPHFTDNRNIYLLFIKFCTRTKSKTDSLLRNTLDLWFSGNYRKINLLLSKRRDSACCMLHAAHLCSCVSFSLKMHFLSCEIFAKGISIEYLIFRFLFSISLSAAFDF